MRRAAFAIVSTIVGLVLLLSFKTHPLTTTGRSVAVTTPNPAATGRATHAGSTGSGQASPAPAVSAAAVRSVTGYAVQTPYGPVQVRLTVRGHKITRAEALQVPNGTSLDQQINSYAVPQLNQETVQAQSAHIDMVSGATYTSQGYLYSLQNAIDKAGLR